jgi:hypothetical protein
MTDSIRVLEKSATTPQRPRRLTSRKAIVEALARPSRHQVWVLRSERTIADLIRAMSIAAPRVRGARLISYARPQPVAARVIESAFVRVLLGARAMVDLRDLTGILRSGHPEDYCVGAEWDEGTSTLALWRGDLSVLVVSRSAFPARGGVAADPSKLSIEDGGQTIRMGEYEASVDAILMERDPVHRRRARKRMIREERTLGGSLRRLRLSRGVGRADFPGLDEKTVARIERGEVARPQRRTLKIIARRLGVAVEEIGEF